MKTELVVGAFARLPNGQLVRVEKVDSDGYARVRLIEGEWAERIALCPTEKLEVVRGGERRHVLWFTSVTD